MQPGVRLPSGHAHVLQHILQRTKLNPIKSQELEELYDISDSEVRKIVHHYRFVELYPIASGHKGYCLARTLPEWEKTIKNLKGRAISMLDGLNDITKHNFSDQLTIDL